MCQAGMIYLQALIHIKQWMLMASHSITNSRSLAEKNVFNGLKDLEVLFLDENNF